MDTSVYTCDMVCECCGNYVVEDYNWCSKCEEFVVPVPEEQDDDVLGDLGVDASRDVCLDCVHLNDEQQICDEDCLDYSKFQQKVPVLQAGDEILMADGSFRKVEDVQVLLGENDVFSTLGRILNPVDLGNTAKTILFAVAT